MTCCLLVWQCQLGVPGRVGRRWGPVVSRRGQSVGAAGPGPRPALAAADPGGGCFSVEWAAEARPLVCPRQAPGPESLWTWTESPWTSPSPEFW